MTNNKDKDKPKIVVETVINNRAVEVKSNTENKHEDLPREINGPRGLEPTRYGDWEAKGRCYDF